jgi:excisionase family DNA binding protein
LLETRSHRRRLSSHCALIGERLGLDGRALGAAAWLHDVGMTPMGFADRRGALSPEDRRRLMRHAEIGHALLEGSVSPLHEAAAEIAWTHHERFDGLGYPRGLGGEEIPLAGRVVAVADAFDAVTTERPHRRALPVAGAVEILREERGRQFDPVVLDTLLGALDLAEETLRRFPDQAAGAPEGEYVSVQVAARALRQTESVVRRWADEGRVSAYRTVGGHRRLLLEDVRRLAGELDVLPRLRLVDPPEEALPGTAAALRVLGTQIAGGAAASIYPSEPRGWLASASAAPALRRWLEGLLDGCESGDYAEVMDVTASFLKTARMHGTTLLERHAFLERFSQILIRALGRRGAEHRELAGVRRLIVALQQRALELYD